jgi:Na+/H+ antiporter NhaC
MHLLITHLPIFGSILGGFVLAYGLWTKSNQTKIAAYMLFIISSIGAGIGYLTGEAAEETVENIAGVSKNLVEQHEDFAVIALVSLIVLGVASVFGLFLTSRKSQFARAVAVIVLFVSIISFGLVAWTGYLGGQIRHTEINSNPRLTSQHRVEKVKSIEKERLDETF